MSRRKCVFSDKLKSEYSFLIKRPKFTDSDLTCTICSTNFSIANRGKGQIAKHLESNVHKQAAAALVKNAKIAAFYPKVVPNDRDLEIARMEGTFAFHTVKHDQSFRSMDCTGKLIKTMFESKFSTARTKCEAIATSVIAPNVYQELRKDLDKVSCVSLSTDCSNHLDIKLFPVIVRYFDCRSGVKVKLLDLHQLKNETADTLCETLEVTIDKNELRSKVICLCADNTNANFGGINRQGQNNLFRKLQASLPQQVLGVGCSAHILNNAFEHAANFLPFDIEALVYKIYKYFSIFTVRTESLREYCDFVNVEFKKVLSSCKTRWLSLAPALARAIKIYEGLRSYFLSQSNTPKLIMDFFEKPENELWLWFAHMQAETFHRTVLEVEGNDPSAVEVFRSLQNLENVLTTRKAETFIGLQAKALLSQFVLDGYEAGPFCQSVEQFYTTAIKYLNDWKTPLEEVGTFAWILLKENLLWHSIEHSLEYANEKFPLIEIEEGRLIDEVSYVNNYITEEIIGKWNEPEESLAPDKRWVNIFNEMKKLNLGTENLEKLVGIGFTLPGTSAPVERVFSLVNNYWTSEKTQLKVTTLAAVLSIKINVTLSCTDYYDWLKEKPELLRAIHSSNKYI